MDEQQTSLDVRDKNRSTGPQGPLLVNDLLPCHQRGSCRVYSWGQRAGNLDGQIPVPACDTQSGLRGHPARIHSKNSITSTRTNSCSPVGLGTKRADKRMWQEWTPQLPRGTRLFWPKWEKGHYHHRSRRHSPGKNSKQPLWALSLPGA